ncbi:MAG TPA: DUF1345 domain-containing protein [Methylovirgula sp.]|nr:DUF1345 domain-containing protein [Methylovirgula sp.]
MTFASTLLAPVRVISARPRLFFSLLCGIATVFLLSGHFKLAARLLIGWNVGALLYFILAGLMIATATSDTIKQKAADQDEGSFTILILSTLAAAAAFGAIVAELATVKDLSGLAKGLHIALSGTTIISAWVFIHLMFTLHYAHEYFLERAAKGLRPAKGAGGLIFPDRLEPNYFDFLYFSFVIGVACQTADVEVSSRDMRLIVVVHGVLAFFFNSAVLALTINIAAGLI